MLNYYKTTYNFAHPFTYFSNKLLYHPVNELTTPINPVCKLGNILSWYFAGYLIIRGLILDYFLQYKVIFNIIHKFIIFSGIILSLLNFNVTLFLFPIFIIEIFSLYN
jgi:hypothetical protein